MTQTILVVDDDPHLRETIALTLIEAGYVVRQASDGIKALQAVATVTPDLVLTDVKMPRLDGLQLAESIARGPVSAAVILMSSAPVATRGQTPFLGKPFNLDTMLELIARVLAERGGERQEPAAQGFSPALALRTSGKRVLEGARDV